MAEFANSLVFALTAMNATHATLTLDGDLLKLRCAAGAVSEDIRLDAAAMEKLRGWAERHLALAEKNDAGGLVALGAEMTVWLEGTTGNLTRVLEAGTMPMIVEFVVGKMDAAERTRAFLDAPWELLALDGQHLALRADVALTVLRRIGKAQTPPTASPHRLGVVFMAAAPRGADNLNYEDEEAAILNATKDLGLDLIVEESGTLDLLAACVARERPEVVQISCHGTLEPEPGLLLEDEIGDMDFVTAAKLGQRLAAHHPRVLFLSACETAESHVVLDSLAQSLVRSGAHSVLGWAAPVLDHEAALFASLLLRKLSEGMDLAQAFSSARLELAQHESLQESPNGSLASRDWHLARLYFSAQGGGVLAKAGGPQRLSGRGQAAKTFLDVKGKQVPVAGEVEFVGRRRHVQAILREFRAAPAQRHAGVFVHGMGRQGKSSLAARVARRLEHTHEVLVLFGRYDAASILNAFRERIGTPEVTTLVNDFLPRVEQEASQLLPALTMLLEGPCRQGGQGTRPVLLIVDDFEQVLLPQESGPHRVRPELVEALRALISAFQNAETDSRLLFTSRFEFMLPDRTGAEMTDHLLKAPLHGMSDRESQKQAFAKLRHQTSLAKKQQKNLPELIQRLSRITTAAQGNPGLQDLLHSLCLDDPAACDACLAQMETYRATGEMPDADVLRQFLENLAIGALLNLLAPPARELLRASTLFGLPVPIAVMEKLAEAVGADESAIARLLALGLWESYEDLHDSQESAVALNALVAPLCVPLDTDQAKIYAQQVCRQLAVCWEIQASAKADYSRQIYMTTVEITRLALLGCDASVLSISAEDAVLYLRGKMHYLEAFRWSFEALKVLNASKMPVSVGLLRICAELHIHFGQMDVAKELLKEAIKLCSERELNGSPDHIATLVTYARYLASTGKPREAEKIFVQTEAMLPPGNERTTVQDDLARLYEARGEVELALSIYMKELSEYDALGDLRCKALTMGHIARIRNKLGQVDLALSLHQERLRILEGLGDLREMAVTWGDIARIHFEKGNYQDALELYRQELEVHQRFHDARSVAVTFGDIANILNAKGEHQEAIRLRREELKRYQDFGDRHSGAIALAHIARLQLHSGQKEEALCSYKVVISIFTELEDTRSLAVAKRDMASLQASLGNLNEARVIYEEALSVFMQLKDKKEQALTLSDIGELSHRRGSDDEALSLHEQSLSLFLELGHRSGEANALWRISKILLTKKSFDLAFQKMAQAYAILKSLGHEEGISKTGLDLGRFLCAAGQRKEGLAILQRSLEGFQKLGWSREITGTQAVLEHWSAKAANGA